jgi:site-specific DNA-methyltransferase (adenine-specific)
MTYLYEALQLIFDAIMADLPYGTTACNWDTIIPFEPLWTNYKRLVKGNGAVVLFGSQPFTSKLVMSNLEWFKYEWVWEKTHSPHFLNAKQRPLGVNESVLCFCGGVSIYNPQMVKGARKLNRSGLKESDRKSSKFGINVDILANIPSIEYYPKSIIKISSVRRKDLLHPTQKPVDLLAYLIRTYTNPGEIILDNTMGSGTTLVAAQREGRRAIGIDISEEYCAIAVDRLRQPSFFSIPDKPKDQSAEQLSLSLK